MAALGLLSVLMAYVEAIGITHYFGVKCAAVHAIIPFFLLGIGLDNMFVLISSLDITNKELTAQ